MGKRRKKNVRFTWLVLFLCVVCESISFSLVSCFFSVSFYSGPLNYFSHFFLTLLFNFKYSNTQLISVTLSLHIDRHMNLLASFSLSISHSIAPRYCCLVNFSLFFLSLVSVKNLFYCILSSIRFDLGNRGRTVWRL